MKLSKSSTALGTPRGNILEFPDEIIPHWSITRMRLAATLCGKAHGDWGRHLTVGFASPLSRLRSTHGYALAAAYAALLCW
ncbi:MAG: hypothetical protein IKP00_14800 [Victivallales bacterium]|nr:hypothetical protein [Victivallales bacterium]